MLVISSDNDVLAPKDRWHCILWKHLRGLVEDYIVKGAGCSDELTDRKRAGHPTRAYGSQHFRSLGEDLAERLVLAALRRLTPYQGFLFRESVHSRDGPLRMSTSYPIRRKLQPG